MAGESTNELPRSEKTAVFPTLSCKAGPRKESVLLSNPVQLASTSGNSYERRISILGYQFTTQLCIPTRQGHALDIRWRS